MASRQYCSEIEDGCCDDLYEIAHPRHEGVFVIDRRSAAPITHTRARMLADQFGARVLYHALECNAASPSRESSLLKTQKRQLLAF
jgi:hypothetical protein